MLQDVTNKARLMYSAGFIQGRAAAAGIPEVESRRVLFHDSNTLVLETYSHIPEIMRMQPLT